MSRSDLSRFGMPFPSTWYFHVDLSYLPFLESYPENSPSSNLKLLSIRKEPFVYSATYSSWIRWLSRMYLIIPPRNAMSVPERSAA